MVVGACSALESVLYTYLPLIYAKTQREPEKKEKEKERFAVCAV